MRIACAALALFAASAFAQAVDPEQRQAINELLEALNFKQMVSQMSHAMSLSVPQSIEPMLDGFASGGKLTPEQRAEARKFATEAMSKYFVDVYDDPQIVQGMEDVMARAYAKNFTTAEIRATTAFYVSPAGKKALNIMPRMMQETMPEMMALLTPKMKAIAEKMAKDVVKKVEADGKGKAASK